MTARQFPLGKTPARPGAVKLRMGDYLRGGLPQPPTGAFGHQALHAAAWEMFANDQYGDCVWAGAAHETELWNDEAAASARFSDRNVLAAYSAVTGFDPDDPSTDQGTDMEVAAKYRRKTGIADISGRRHKVAAYLAIDAGNLRQLWTAVYLFGAAGIGVKFPASAMEQFDAGQPWDVVPGSEIQGGHYVPVVGRAANGNLLVITWGRLQEMTPAFYTAYNDESIAYVSAEALKGGVSLEGFNLTQLEADLAAITAAPPPDPSPAPDPPDPGPDPFDALIAKLRQAWPALDEWLRRHGH